jgi:F0F1-type ATP synthase membrane subunit c/vacuolar-type H+-ATPase subunit K
MKRKSVSILCALAIGMAGTSSALANGDPGSMVVDTVLVRPACFVATIFGSAFFVISLPFAAASKSVHRSAHALVVAPAQATFTRPLGDMDALID